MHPYLKYLGVAAALAVVGVLVINTINRGSGPIVQACTMEAKICPDGSAVGRTGPNCEFAACPDIATSERETVTARVGQTVRALDVSITPLEIVEDSRCPQDVQCIWAGTIKVRATLVSGLGTSPVTFEIGQSITTEAEFVTLTGVTPAPKAGEPIDPADYRFTFEVAKRPL